MQHGIRCAFMRGGTSRGPLFQHTDLPSRKTHPELVDKILLRVLTPMIDSLAGSPSVTTKTAIISPASRPEADIDMHFAQVDSASRRVDWTPLCGNMLSAVGPFAIERNMIKCKGDITDIVIHNVSTGALVDVRMNTPNGNITYDGDTIISGVQGTGCGIELKFREIEGAKTGKVLPTGSPRNTLKNGIDVSVVDIATPIMFIRASDLGKTCHETSDDLTNDKHMLDSLLKMREEVKQIMVPFKGSDDPKSVLPKIVMVGKAETEKGHLAARYFTPWACHPAYAVGGAVCTAAAAALPGSVVRDVVKKEAVDGGFEVVDIEHPSGGITAALDVDVGVGRSGLVIRSGGCVRTARMIMDGFVYVPKTVWNGVL